MQDSEVKTVARSSLTRQLLGLPFLIGGLAALYATLGQPGVSGDNLMGGVVFGLIFTVVGLGLTLYRSGLVLDRRAGRAVRWRGLLVPIWREEIPLEPVTHVRLSRERRGSGKNSRTVYPVILQAPDKLEVQAPPRYPAARQLAESVARFLQLELHDDTAGQTEVRQPEHLDESVRERYRREGLAAPMPSLPAGARLSLRRDAGDQLIDIPAQGFRRFYLFLLVLLVPFYALAAPFMLGFGGEEMDAFEIVFFCLFFAGPLLVVLGFIGFMSWYRETVRITGDAIEVAAGSLLRRTRRMAGDDIEEVVAPGDPLRQFRESMAARAGDEAQGQLDPAVAEKVLRLVSPFGVSGQVVLRGDQGSIGLGRNLPAAEKQWLYQALVHYLVNQSGAGHAGPRPAGPAGAGAPVSDSASKAWIWIVALLLIAASAAYEFGLLR